MYPDMASIFAAKARRRKELAELPIEVKFEIGLMLREIAMPIDRMRSCTGKVKYGHKETARDAAVAMNLKTGGTLEAYKCRHCPQYHIGSRG